MNVRGVEPAPLVVGGFMALAGLLFVANPFLAPVPVDGVDVPVVAFSFVALAVALDFGALLFYWQGELTAAKVHGIAGVGWTLVVVGPALGSGPLWIAGLVVVIAGAVFLVSRLVAHQSVGE